MSVGVYLVFKVTTSYEKLYQDNDRSTEKYMILWDVVKLYKILEIVVISTPNVNQPFETAQFYTTHNVAKRFTTSQDICSGRFLCLFGKRTVVEFM